MSAVEAFKANAKAVVKDYSVEPRTRYSTISGVNGPLVILENVKGPKFAEIVEVGYRPCPHLLAKEKLALVAEIGYFTFGSYPHVAAMRFLACLVAPRQSSLAFVYTCSCILATF